MRFELEPFNRDVPNEELLADLKRVAESLHEGRLTFRDYRSEGRYAATTVCSRFGSWNKALELAGLKISMRHRIDDVTLFTNLEEIWRQLGRQPRSRDLVSIPTKVSKSVYETRFGSWRKALEAFIAWVGAEGDSADDKAIVPPSGRKTPRQPNLRLRFKVMRRDRFRCCQCGRAPASTPGLELHVDHILAWSENGETVIENLRTLCSDCNLGKSNCAQNLE